MSIYESKIKVNPVVVLCDVYKHAPILSEHRKVSLPGQVNISTKIPLILRGILGISFITFLQFYIYLKLLRTLTGQLLLHQIQ